MDLIPPNFEAYRKSGIQTGVADQRMAELSPLQRQLLQEQDFGFYGNALWAKQDEVVNPQHGRNALEMDWDTLLDLGTAIMSRLHASGFFYQKGNNGAASAEGVKCEALDEIPKVSEERIARRYALDLAKAEANAIFKEQNLEERAKLLKQSIIPSQELFEALIFSTFDTYLNPELDHDFYQIVIDVMELGLHKEYYNHPIIDVYESDKGITIITGSKLKITVDNVDFNSQFGGDGYSPPRDRYQKRRNLKFEGQTPQNIAKLNRENSCTILLNDIERIETIPELFKHREETKKELYYKDKAWRNQWNQEAEETHINQFIADTLRGPTVKTVNIKTYTYEIIHEGVTYKTRLREGSSPNYNSWFDETNMIVGSALGQVLMKKFLAAELIPDEHVETVTSIPINPPGSVDEESLRVRVWREKYKFQWRRQQATVDLNFTAAQWSKIFDAYNKQLEILKTLKPRQEVIDENIEKLSPEQTIKIIENMIYNTSNIAQVWNKVVSPLFRNRKLDIKGKRLTLNTSQFSKVRQLLLDRKNKLINKKEENNEV